MSRMRAPNYHIQTGRKAGFTAQKFRYDRPGEPGVDHDPHAAADMALARRVGETLERHYPAHPWMVEVNHAQGVVYISLPIIMRRGQKFVLHIDRLAADPALRAVIRAGGEILERYNVPRSGFNLDTFLNVRAAQPHNQPKPRLFVPDHYLPKGPADAARPHIIMPA